MYSHGQELFYKFVSRITKKLVKTTLVHDCSSLMSCDARKIKVLNAREMKKRNSKK